MFNPETIRLMREYQCVSLNEAMKFSVLVPKWETGEVSPSFDEIEEYARFLKTQEALFFSRPDELEQFYKLKILDYRGLDAGRPCAWINEIYYWAQKLQFEAFIRIKVLGRLNVDHPLLKFKPKKPIDLADKFKKLARIANARVPGTSLPPEVLICKKLVESLDFCVLISDSFNSVYGKYAFGFDCEDFDCVAIYDERGVLPFVLINETSNTELWPMAILCAVALISLGESAIFKVKELQNYDSGSWALEAATHMYNYIVSKHDLLPYTG